MIPMWLLDQQEQSQLSYARKITVDLLDCLICARVCICVCLRTRVYVASCMFEEN